MIVVKLGGSIITDKTKYKKFNLKITEELVKVLPKKDLILVHGGGSYGHILAKKYRLHEGLVENNRKFYSKVQMDMMDLNFKILKLMIKQNILAISIPPHSFHIHNKKFDFELFEKYLELGLVPVTYGDVILDLDKKMSICSGDYLIKNLALHFNPELVIFVTDVDGVFDKNPVIYPDAKLIENLDLTTEFDASINTDDVTGGIKGKLDTIRDIVKYGRKCIIINGNYPDRLSNAILNKHVIGTIIGD